MASRGGGERDFPGTVIKRHTQMLARLRRFVCALAHITSCCLRILTRRFRAEIFENNDFLWVALALYCGLGMFTRRLKLDF